MESLYVIISLNKIVIKVRVKGISYSLNIIY